MSKCRKRAKFCSFLPKPPLLSRRFIDAVLLKAGTTYRLHAMMVYGNFHLVGMFEKVRWMQVVDAVLSTAADLMPVPLRNATTAVELRRLWMRWKRNIDLGLYENTELAMINTIGRIRDFICAEATSPVFAYLLMAFKRFKLLMVSYKKSN